MKRFLFTVVNLLLAVCVVRAADDAAADRLPPNLGHSLRQLVAWHRAQPQVLSASERRTHLAQQFPGRVRRLQTTVNVDRAVVKVVLDGSVSSSEVRSNLTALGLEIFATDVPGYGGTVFSAKLPLDAAERVALLPGVRSVALVHRPWKHIGLVTTGGVSALNAYESGTSTDGAGITVGVISDSFDIATQDIQGKPLTIHAASDVVSGDLPGPGNPNGHLTPVYVLAEGDSSSDQPPLDEGRAMLQIVHDLAPSATLAFAAAGATPEVFAASVRALRTDPVAHCDVIVDDLTFPEEPMFFDGPAAQAVYDVTHDATLSGRKVLYYAAAGNEGDCGYVADFLPVDAAFARNGVSAGNLKLDQVPGTLDANGYHNFDVRPGKIAIAQKIVVAGGEAEVDLQWDSPPGQTGADAADFNLLVFDAEGNYLPELSGKDHNIVMGNTLELVDLPAGDNNSKAVYQLAITCGERNSDNARHLRYVVNANGTFTAKFAGHDAPTIFGHAAAVGADAVAAYDVHYNTIEPYSSFGPVTIFFDRNGDAQPAEIRQQPTLAAVDGVDNTFLGADTDGDRYPNFYGTSAAAPHAAGCAALLLQASGGSGSLTNQQARALLQSNAFAHSIDPNTTAFTATATDGTEAIVTLAEVRDDINPAGAKNVFRLSFQGQDTQRLRKIVLSLNQGRLTFDDSADGLPFTIGVVSGGFQKSDVTATIGSSYAAESTAAQTYRNQLTLLFAPDAFGPGASINFGVGIKNISDNPGGLDPLGWAMLGTTFKARLTSPTGKTKVTTQANAPSPNYGTGWSPVVGAGLINYDNTLSSLREGGPPDTPDSHAALTPSNLLLRTSAGQLLEVTPGGQIVQLFDLPGVQGAVVLANGMVVALCRGINGPFLTLLDPVTGTTTTATYPGWQTTFGDYQANQIVSEGNRVFVIDAAVPQAAGKATSLLLCYDSTNDTWSSFGTPLDTSNGGNYLSLLAGLDGSVYATSIQSYFTSRPTEIYDPASLQLLRTTSQLQPAIGVFRLPPLTLDKSGDVFEIVATAEAYGAMLPNVVRLAADGTVAATLNLDQLAGQLQIGHPLGDLKVDGKGKIYVTTAGGIIVTDTSLNKAQFYRVSAGSDDGSLERASLSLVSP